MLNPLPEASKCLVVTKEQVGSLIGKLKVKKGNIPGLLPTWLVKLSQDFISPLLTDIINESFQSCLVPSCWKSGFVTPLFKKCIFTSLDDLRSITQTEIFSKITESFMYDHLYNELESKLSFSQFGSIKKSSTAHYLIKLDDFILKSCEIPGAIVIINILDMRNILF